MALEIQNEAIVQLIGFHVGRKLYGTDILAVREILRDPDIETSEEGTDFMRGVVYLRGEPIPVIDMRFCLGLNQDAGSPDRNWVLVVQSGKWPAGYLVDSVTRILRVSTDHILPPPEIIMAGLRSPYIRGVCDTENGLLVVLDMDRILLGEEQRSIQQLTLA